MSSPAQMAANLANAQHSTGPRTEAGKAASSQNAVKSGLFSTRDFIRPGEQSLYQELTESLRLSLAPVGDLECILVDEIRRTTWRLRRCGETEATMVDTCIQARAAASAGQDTPVPDPLQIEATAKLQFSVDRARSQCHRLLHKCTAELRKLQTERLFRRQELGQKADVAFMGLADLRGIRKSLDESLVGALRNAKWQALEHETEIAWQYSQSATETLAQTPNLADEPFDQFYPEMPVTKQTRDANQTPRAESRNARCSCGSGLKYKRCCALKAAA